MLKPEIPKPKILRQANIHIQAQNTQSTKMLKVPKYPRFQDWNNFFSFGYFGSEKFRLETFFCYSLNI